MVPGDGVGVSAGVGELVRHVEREVEEQLPVVGAIGATQGEVDVLDGVVGVDVVRWVEVIEIEAGLRRLPEQVARPPC